MVYVVDLDDTLVLTKNLNNDAYNFALEKNGQKRFSLNKRITRENLNNIPKNQIITDKQNYFTQKWLKYRIVVNEEILNILQNQDKENCYGLQTISLRLKNIILKQTILYLNNKPKAVFQDNELVKFIISVRVIFVVCDNIYKD